jgi:EmrB/QacA subfamily drug resistance transporter
MSDELTVSSDKPEYVLPLPQEKVEESQGTELQDAAGSTGGAHPETFKLSARGYGVMTVFMVLTLLVAIDATSIGAALVVITTDLKGTTTEAVWAGGAFALASAVCQPIIGSLSEIYGRRPLTQVSTLFFTVGSIICGTAPNFSALNAGRAIQGFGAGGILVLTEIIVTDLVPLRERGKYFGYIGAMWALGTVVGPLVGGGFATSTTWRWIFYFNLPFCGIALVTIQLLLKLHLEDSTSREKLARIDFTGIIFFALADTSLLLGVTFGGVMFPWSSWHVLVPLILGFVGLAGFGVYEFCIPKHPMVRIVVFANRSALVAYIQVMLHGLILSCVIYYLPLYYQGVKGYTPVIAGVSLLPESVAIAPCAILAGQVISRTGHYLWLSWVAWAFVTAGAGLLYLLKPDTSVGQFIGLNILFSIGTGILFASLNLSVLAPNTNENTPYAAAMLSFVRVMGQAFGIAIGGSVFSNQMSSRIAKEPDLADFQGTTDTVLLVETIRLLPPSTIKDQLVVALDKSVGTVFLVMIAFSGFAFALNILAKEYSLDVQYTSKQRVIEKHETTTPQSPPV